MRKIALNYGLAAGFIIVLVSFPLLGFMVESGFGELLGFTIMIVAFSAIFFGIRKFRDEELNGTISFKNAFFMGLYITVLASVIYAGSWMVYSESFMPDFAEKYFSQEITKLQESGEDQAIIDEKITEMREFAEMYKNPVVKFAYTLLEIFPVGLIISIISALILRDSGKEEKLGMET